MGNQEADFYSNKLCHVPISLVCVLTMLHDPMEEPDFYQQHIECTEVGQKGEKQSILGGSGIVLQWKICLIWILKDEKVCDQQESGIKG